MQQLTDLVHRHLPVGPPVGRILVVLALFLTAWLVTRLAGVVAAKLVDRSERRRVGGAADTGVIASLRQRETAINLIQTSVSYFVFALALLLSVATLLGARRVETVVGAGFLAILIGFAAQRFLTDVIAGLLMFFEGWFRVGDNVEIAPWGIQGVVERVTLRSITIRALDGQLMHVANANVLAMKVSPRGFREVEFELFASDREAGEELVGRVAKIVPVGPTHFVRRPEVVETEELDAELVRIRARTAVAPGREWLAEEFLPELVKERAADGLLVHGPVVTLVDEQATRRFARAVWTSGDAATRARRARPLARLRRTEEREHAQ